jgi:hypothetical protein
VDQGEKKPGFWKRISFKGLKKKKSTESEPLDYEEGFKEDNTFGYNSEWTVVDEEDIPAEELKVEEAKVQEEDPEMKKFLDAQKKQ